MHCARKCLAAGASLPLRCHSDEEATRLSIRKTAIIWSPLRNRTVGLLITMYRTAVLQPQVDRLTSANTSTHRH